MTWGGRLANLFPFVHGSLILAALFNFVRGPNGLSVFLVVSALYLLPPLLFRLHQWRWPLREGITDLARPIYSRWWTSHRLQTLYIALPMVESVLHLVPGLYSAWLRLWGSRIGRGVFWTPRVEVVDRSLLEIGDHVVVGHLAIFCSHVVTPAKGRLRLFVKRIRVGNGAVVGAEVRLGPGSRVAETETIKSQTVLYWKGELP